MAETMTPSSEPMTDGQVDKAVGHYRDMLHKHRAEIGSSEAVQRVLGQPEYLAEQIAVIRRRVEATLILVPRPPVTVTLPERHDPDMYYRTREGLYVYGDFRNRIVAKAKPTEAGATFKVSIAGLGKDATDAEIESALPAKHIFTETAACVVIAGMIAKQPNGEEGDLTTERVNLLYTPSCVARVYWRADYAYWFVGTWLRDDFGWRAGLRVISPAN